MEKTGNVRWESIMYFYTRDCVKAGFLRKVTGVWHLTKEEEKAMSRGRESLLEAAKVAH